MRKLKFFESKPISGGDDSQPNAGAAMDFSTGADDAGRKTLNDLHILRMLYLDHFLLILGQYNQMTQDGSALEDENQYLFLVKESQVKTAFRTSHSILFLDKNIDNVMG